jgi:hypothetical protein
MEKSWRNAEQLLAEEAGETGEGGGGFSGDYKEKK